MADAPEHDVRILRPTSPTSAERQATVRSALSGHTHGGQMFLGTCLYTSLLTSAGAWTLRRGWVYVSGHRLLGTTDAVDVQSEITLLRLVRAA